MNTWYILGLGSLAVERPTVMVRKGDTPFPDQSALTPDKAVRQDVYSLWKSEGRRFNPCPGRSRVPPLQDGKGASPLNPLVLAGYNFIFCSILYIFLKNKQVQSLKFQRNLRDHLAEGQMSTCPGRNFNF